MHKFWEAAWKNYVRIRGSNVFLAMLFKIRRGVTVNKKSASKFQLNDIIYFLFKAV